jgi:hypothetical protein
MNKLVCIVVVALARIGHADPFTESSGHSSAAEALSTCEDILKASPSPGLVDYQKFRDYMSKLDDAKASDPDIMKKALQVKTYLGMHPAVEFPKCTALLEQYVKGVDAEKQPAVDATCAHNIDRSLSDLGDQAANWKKDKSGSISLMRMDLEQARSMMFWTTNLKTPGARCAPNDQFKKAFAPLAGKLKQAEQTAVTVEQAAGVKFTGIKGGNTLVYVDLKTNKVLDHQP